MGPYGTTMSVMVPGMASFNGYYPSYYQPVRQVFIERTIVYPSWPDGYFETGRACHSNVVCINGACYRCN